MVIMAGQTLPGSWTQVSQVLKMFALFVNVADVVVVPAKPVKKRTYALIAIVTGQKCT